MDPAFKLVGDQVQSAGNFLRAYVELVLLLSVTGAAALASGDYFLWTLAVLTWLAMCAHVLIFVPHLFDAIVAKPTRTTIAAATVLTASLLIATSITTAGAAVALVDLARG